MDTTENRRQELLDKIDDLETTLSEMKHQLKAEDEAAQHAAIDRLEEYLGDLDNKHTNLQDFWKVLLEDFKKLFNKSDSDGGKQ